MSTCDETVKVKNGDGESDEYVEVLKMLLESSEQNTCTTASAGYNVSILGGLFSAEAGADAANDCTSFSTVFTNTSSVMRDFACSLNETVSTQVANATMSQSISVRLISKNGSITADGLNLSQNVEWKYTNDSVMNSTQINDWSSQIVNAVESDLQSLIDNEREGWSSTLDSTSIVFSNVENRNELARVAVTRIITENITNILSQQSAEVVLEAYGDIKLTNLELSQNMYFDQVISQTLSQSLDTTIDNLLEADSSNKVVSTIKNSMTGNKATNYLEIIFGVLVFLVAVVLLYSAIKNSITGKKPTNYVQIAFGVVLFIVAFVLLL